MEWVYRYAMLYLNAKLTLLDVPKNPENAYKLTACNSGVIAHLFLRPLYVAYSQYTGAFDTTWCVLSISERAHEILVVFKEDQARLANCPGS